jgi:hypothetical protein
MNSKFASGLAFLGLMICAGGAQAQTFDPGWGAVVTPNPYIVPSGGVLDETFSVSITANSLLPTGGPATFSSDSIGDLPLGVTILDDGVQDALLSSGEIPVTPGTPYVNTFDLAIPAGTPSFVGDFVVFDDNGNNNNETNSGDATPGNTFGNFLVTPSAVPEPGTIALLATSALSGGALLLRRRR